MDIYFKIVSCLSRELFIFFPIYAELYHSFICTSFNLRIMFLRIVPVSKHRSVKLHSYFTRMFCLFVFCFLGVFFILWGSAFLFGYQLYNLLESTLHAYQYSWCLRSNIPLSIIIVLGKPHHMYTFLNESPSYGPCIGVNKNNNLNYTQHFKQNVAKYYILMMGVPGNIFDDFTCPMFSYVEPV